MIKITIEATGEMGRGKSLAISDMIGGLRDREHFINIQRTDHREHGLERTIIELKLKHEGEI